MFFRLFIGVLLASGVLTISLGTNAQEVERSGKVFHRAICGPVVGDAFRCHAHVVTDASGHVLRNRGTPIDGFAPSSLRDAYKVTATGYAATVIAVVVAYDYPNAEADLNVYRKQFGLPACTKKNGCFKKFNQNGEQKNYPVQDFDWAREAALDLDMVSAMCPG